MSAPVLQDTGIASELHNQNQEIFKLTILSSILVQRVRLGFNLTSEDGNKKKFVFHGYFSLILSLTIVAAALIWLIYVDLPYQYYLVASFGVVAIIGIVAFVILNKKLKI